MGGQDEGGSGRSGGKDLKVTLPSKYNYDKKMMGAEWHGKFDIRINENRPVPEITDPTDAILKITSTCICGSDLHMYTGAFPGVRRGDLMGHEFMGIVEKVGDKVQNVAVGDRVVASFDLGCGACMYCKMGLFSCCDTTNPVKDTEELYGHRTAGMHGYTHLTGGWDGGQAQFARVPFADVNLLKVPTGKRDETYVFLSDILPTAWHANELGQVGEGDRVAIWGAGPVGILTAHCAKVRGAKQIISIDCVKYRLDHVQRVVPGVEVINFAEEDLRAKLREMTGGPGPDVGIEAVGMHYAKSFISKMEMKLSLETDPSDIMNEIIYNVRKGGRISDVGVYAAYCNHYNIGAFMEKGMSMAAGQTPCQRYWPQLLKMIEEGKLDPTIVITHILPLEEAPKGYKIFNNKELGCIKVVMKPPGAYSSKSDLEKTCDDIKNKLSVKDK